MGSDKTTVVYIEWVDAHGGGGQYDLDYVKKSRMDEMKTASLLVEETDTYITIAQDLFRTTGESPQARAFMTIPKVNITRIERWNPLEVPVERGY